MVSSEPFKDLIIIFIGKAPEMIELKRVWLFSIQRCTEEYQRLEDRRISLADGCLSIDWSFLGSLLTNQILDKVN